MKQMLIKWQFFWVHDCELLRSRCYKHFNLIKAVTKQASFWLIKSNIHHECWKTCNSRKSIDLFACVVSIVRLICKGVVSWIRSASTISPYYVNTRHVSIKCTKMKRKCFSEELILRCHISLWGMITLTAVPLTVISRPYRFAKKKNNKSINLSTINRAGQKCIKHRIFTSLLLETFLRKTWRC